MPPRKLPPYDVLHRLLIEEGRTYREVAAMYGVNSQQQVTRTFFRDAERLGLPKPSKWKLPPWPVLKRHIFEEGLTYAEIGAKYGAAKGTVEDTVKRRAIAAGESFPLFVNGSRAWYIRQQRACRMFNDAKYVNTALLADVMRDWLHRTGWSQERMAAYAGLSQACISRVVNRAHPSTERRIAEIINTLMDDVDWVNGYFEDDDADPMHHRANKTRMERAVERMAEREERLRESAA